MWGESKSNYLFDVAASERHSIADFIVATRSAAAVRPDLNRALHSMAAAGIEFPVVAKPDIGSHGVGVRRINGPAALRDWLGGFPRGAKLIVQRLVPYAMEAVVQYARLPGEPHGRVLSLTFRYFPQVIGDGASTLRELILADPRVQRKAYLHFGDDHFGVGAGELARVPGLGEVVQIALIGNQQARALYCDAGGAVTPALEQRFDAIARSMREFHYGRFDIRFRSIEALLRGEDFSIVEINGIGGAAIDAWDPELHVREAYRRLIAQQRLLFRIGEHNRARGFVPMRLAELLRHLIRHGRLIRQYPASA
jgi:hypothetical protein